MKEEKNIYNTIMMNFDIQIVGPKIKNGNIDQWIETLVKFKYPTSDNIEEILVAHGKLLKLFKRITGMEKRSLASKYLHFHKPDLFFIFDSRAMKSIRKLVPPQKRTLIKNKDVDLEYADFCRRCLKLRDEIEKRFKLIYIYLHESWINFYWFIKF